jgi:two-component system NtrC family sensor kinase
MRIGQTGFAFIMNKEGELQTLAPKKTMFDTHTYLKLAEGVHDDVLVISNRIDGHGQYMLAIAPLKNGQWLFVYQQQASEIFAGLNKALLLAMGIVLIGILGIASTGVILSSHMISRIQTINAEKEVMNQQVLQAGKMAAVGELAAGIAHEINNPVAIMVEEAGWVEDLLEDEKLSSAENEQEIQRALHEIAIQGKRSKDITHKLLSFARKTDSRVQEVDLTELIEEILGVSNQRAKFASVTVHTEIQPDLPLVQASPTEMQQVVLNLVNNALDAMENMQGGELTIRAALQEQWVVVEVEDTGPGIAKHDQERIFEPFYTTKAVGKGTGLGLSICYGIVEKMGGHIRVKSRIGAGSTFILELPVSGDIGGKKAKG